jgi:hypothetical protein
LAVLCRRFVLILLKYHYFAPLILLCVYYNIYIHTVKYLFYLCSVLFLWDAACLSVYMYACMYGWMCPSLVPEELDALCSYLPFKSLSAIVLWPVNMNKLKKLEIFKWVQHTNRQFSIKRFGRNFSNLWRPFP